MGHSEYDPASRERRAWNAGRKLGTKRPLKPQQVWAIRFWLDGQRHLRDRAHCSIWPSAASCAVAIWSRFASVISSAEAVSAHEPLWFNRRRAGPFSSSSSNRHGQVS
jgi:hypothetical protein